MEVLPSLPSPSALPYQVAVAGCHSGSTTLCAAPEASPEPKRHAAHTSDDTRSTARMEKPQAAEELEEAPAMARTYMKSRERRRHSQAANTLPTLLLSCAEMAGLAQSLEWWWYFLLSLGSPLRLREAPVPDALSAQSCHPAQMPGKGTMGMHE
jgi:hypothetical protein